MSWFKQSDSEEIACLRKNYLKEGLELSKLYHKNCNSIERELPSNLFNQFRIVERLENEYAKSCSLLGHKFMTIDFVGLVQQKGKGISYMHFEEYMYHPVPIAEILYYARQRREETETYHRILNNYENNLFTKI